MDEDGHLIVDELCPQVGTITAEELERKGKRLRALLRTIDAQAARR